MSAQLIPSVTGKPSDQWINKYWIDHMDRVLVTPFGLLSHDEAQASRIEELVSQPFDEVIIDNCAYSIHKGYFYASPLERLLAQMELAKSVSSGTITLVVPDFVQKPKQTMEAYRELEPILRGLNHDKVRLMYVLQGTPGDMRDIARYVLSLNIPVDIAIATQERKSRREILSIANLIRSLPTGLRTHLFGETRQWVLDILSPLVTSYDTSNCYWTAYHNGHRGEALSFFTAFNVAKALNSPFRRVDVRDYLKESF